MKDNFIKTTSEDMYNLLLANNLTYLGKEGDLYCFINDPKTYMFSEDKKKEILYTNMICLQES